MSLCVRIRKRLAAFTLDASFDVERADRVMALLGPSGCGKSVTLKCIAGVMRPDEGRIVLNGRTLFDSEAGVDLPPQRRRVGYLFQDSALFPTMDVLHNVMAGVREGGRAERRERARRELCAMRLDGVERLRPAQLSGGQRQRVAMARILASDPELILLDEPFSALDGYLRWQLELELVDELRAFSGGAVLVTHDRDEVHRLAQDVCVIDRGQTEPLVSVHELFARPRTVAAALISGCKNVSRARVVGDRLLACDDWGVTLACADAPDARVTHVGIRAHYLTAAPTEPAPAVPAPAGKRDAAPRPAPGANRIPCVVERVIDGTFSTIVMARTPGGALLRYECEKDAWAALGGATRVTFGIAPGCVMPLCEGCAKGGGGHA